MTNTVEVSVVDSAWTLVASGAAIGFMTGEGIVKIKYRESDSLPTDAVGHTLEMQVGSYISFNVVAGQNVYVKSTRGTSQVAITLES